MADDKLLATFEKKFGKGVVVKGNKGFQQVEKNPTDIASVDVILAGGVPKGRVIEIFGPESSGKTTLCQHIIGAKQAMGGVCAFVDVENALDPSYAQKCGVRIEDLYLSQPETGEQAMDVTVALIESGVIDTIVVDSVAMLTPKAEIEGDMDDQHMMLLPRMMAKALRKIVSAQMHSPTNVIFTNQLRQKPTTYGSPYVTPGGMALRFATSVRMEVKPGDKIWNASNTVVVARHTKVNVIKNKTAPPFRQTGFQIAFNSTEGIYGIDKKRDLFFSALLVGAIKKSGNTYTLLGNRLGVGKEAAVSAFKKSEDAQGSARNHIYEFIYSGNTVAPVIESNEQDEEDLVLLDKAIDHDMEGKDDTGADE